MPASSDRDSPKASARFSPFTPSLSRPRDASLKTIATRKTSKLFSSELHGDGEGALLSQVQETQFFGQFGVDVSRRRSSPFTTPPHCRIPLVSVINSPLKSSASLASIEEDELASSEEEELDLAGDYQSGVNSWALLPDEDDEELSMADTWSESDPQYTPNVLDTDGYPVDASVSTPTSTTQVSDPEVKVEEAISQHTSNAAEITKLMELTPFEQWIIERVREAKQDGVSAADGFYRLRARCIEQGRRELNLMAREADLLRRLKEINTLSQNLD
ncbi:hypothetical protein B0H16DRAFT_1827565 [Mycena metata]|uniref:Uncharacterized protein n=1 Tax=Mycena metata TaxID=1033252 RepID=A0AAD7GTZ6_9AGAR|nr:hypothetical protein B0H16DRAFT_1827565 [Mycena metata]